MDKKHKITVVVTIATLTAGMVLCAIGWSFARQGLDSARTELSSTLVTQESNMRELSDSKDELLITKTELQDTKNYLSVVETELKNLKHYLVSPCFHYEGETYLKNVEAELRTTKMKLLAIQNEAFHLLNPTFDEVIDFLIRDRTDRNEYLADGYTCSHFARDVNNNAESQGIRCAYVEIRFPKGSHAIIGFDTVDKGMVYFDPVTDEKVTPIVGKEYWLCVEPEPGRYYKKPAYYDDTIMNIVVIW